MDQTKALSNITILDLSRVLCGPYCTMLLADMGAQIIKVENPDGGDDTRSWGPMRNDASVYFASITRNKRSVTLNLKDPEAKALFKKLVAKADVVLENFRPGVMKKMGLGYEDLKKVNDKIIYACVSGFGTEGPYSQRPGYDLIAQAMSGVMSVTGWPDGPPTHVGISIGDIMSGQNIAIGILSAINARNLTGQPQYVEVALVDTIVSGLTTVVLPYTENGTVPTRMGNRMATLAPYESYAAKDGEMIIACGNQKLFEYLCDRILQRPELKEDPRYLTMPDRTVNYASLKEYVEEWTRQHTVDEAVDIVLAAGIPAAPIFDMSQVVNNEHIAKVRQMYVPLDHPVIGEMTVTGNPIKMDCVTPEEWTPAPSLGEHNAEVFGALGVDAATLEQLKKDGTI
ncbi:MAG: CaiB/BaiF CoA transferase family protein [Oscillospiraceae bacterium]